MELKFEIIDRCKQLINLFNQRIENMNPDQEYEYIRKMTEDDFLFRVAIPFEDRPARFSGRKLQIGNMQIALKHWRSWDTERSDIPRAKPWGESFGDPYKWLIEDCRESEGVTKMLIGVWGIRGNEWRYILQLGKITGDDPFVSLEKMRFLPFLYTANKRISGVKTEYARRISYINHNEHMDVECRLIGEPDDSINFALYIQKFN
jgi:hypothetical protein